MRRQIGLGIVQISPGIVTIRFRPAIRGARGMGGSRLRRGQTIERIVRVILAARGIQHVGDGHDIAVVMVIGVRVIVGNAASFAAS